MRSLLVRLKKVEDIPMNLELGDSRRGLEEGVELPMFGSHFPN
jgi:hypothetical protein